MDMLIQEIELWYVIPSIRRGLALEMQKLGMKNVDIAEKLGLTKAAISQYLNNTRANEFIFNNEIKNEIKKSAGKIDDKKDTVQEIQRIIKMLRNSREVCNFHSLKEQVHVNCDICFRK